MDSLQHVSSESSGRCDHRRTEIEMNEYMEDTQDYVCSISPPEFVEFCMELLKNYAMKENLKDFVIEHNVKQEAPDGTYQLDIIASFNALDVQLKILCECKQYSSPVKRERVEILEGRLKSLGMHKGILLSTSGFQSGAIKYAKFHGIALIQVFDHSCQKYSHSGGPNAEVNENNPLKYIEDHWPPYRAICFSDKAKEPVVLFPTTEIVAAIYSEANKMLKEQYGFEVPLSDGEDPSIHSAKNNTGRSARL